MKNTRVRIEVDTLRVTYPGLMPVLRSPAEVTFINEPVPLSIEPSRIWVAVERIDENNVITGKGSNFDWNGHQWIGLGRTFKDQEEIVKYMEDSLAVQS